MNTDILDKIGAVDRKVENREHDGRPARVVIATRVYNTDVEDMWDAVSNPTRIPRWFLPVSGELELGGRYQLEGNAGGTITHCEAPHFLAVTWEFGGGMSWLELRLTAEPDGRTRFQLEHIAPAEGDAGKFWEQYGPGATGVGWDLALNGLATHLATGAALDPAKAEAWSMSDEGKAFIRGASADWGRASIAAGTDEAAAKSAAANTTAFYTGEPAPAEV